MKKISIIGMLITLFSIPAIAAQVEYNKTITVVGVEKGERAYFRMVEPLTSPCIYSVIYFDLSTGSGKSFLSALLSAKMAGKKISVVSYDIDATNYCTLGSVEIAQ